jgi:hypothetical protein
MTIGLAEMRAAGLGLAARSLEPGERRTFEVTIRVETGTAVARSISTGSP